MVGRKLAAATAASSILAVCVLAALPAGAASTGAISGHIETRQAVPNPALAGACVHVWLGSKIVASTKSTVNGTFTVNVAPGTYTVQFADNAFCGGGNFYGEWWQTAKSQAVSSPVKVNPGMTTSGLYALMLPLPVS